MASRMLAGTMPDTPAHTVAASTAVVAAMRYVLRRFGAAAGALRRIAWRVPPSASSARGINRNVCYGAAKTALVVYTISATGIFASCTTCCRTDSAGGLSRPPCGSGAAASSGVCADTVDRLASRLACRYAVRFSLVISKSFSSTTWIINLCLPGAVNDLSRITLLGPYHQHRR